MADTKSPRVGRAGLLVAVALGLSAGTALAARPKDLVSPLDQQAFFLPELSISSSHAPLEAVLERLPNRAAWKASAARAKFLVTIDPRSGAATNILGPVPLIPGDGVGNQITLADLTKALGQDVESVAPAGVVAKAARAHVISFGSLLGIDVSQLGEVRAVAVTPELWQVSIPQVFMGIPVRYGRVALTISHGNVVMMGTETWGDVAIDTQPYVNAEDALAAAFAYVGGRASTDEVLQQPRLEIIPVATSDRKSVV
jgi:hypothetical protein